LSLQHLRGGVRIFKSLGELEEIFTGLSSKLDALNQDAVRDKKYDFPVMNEKWLQKVIKRDIKPKEKRILLLTQIGYLRINIFTEYLERVKALQEKKQLNQAVELMNRYAEIASIFISMKSPHGILKRLKELLTKRRIEPGEYLRRWQTSYDEWVKQNDSQQKVDEENRVEEFDRLKTLFIELYTFSFSVDNFPPLRNRRSDR
jgi:hypothetical protein